MESPNVKCVVLLLTVIGAVLAGNCGFHDGRNIDYGAPKFGISTNPNATTENFLLTSDQCTVPSNHIESIRQQFADHDMKSVEVPCIIAVTDNQSLPSYTSAQLEMHMLREFYVDDTPEDCSCVADITPGEFVSGLDIVIHQQSSMEMDEVYIKCEIKAETQTTPLQYGDVVVTTWTIKHHSNSLSTILTTMFIVVALVIGCCVFGIYFGLKNKRESITTTYQYGSLESR